jgi:hypothetical protein
LLNPNQYAYVLTLVSAATVGAVLASRRPRHPVGWLLLALGLSVVVAGVAQGYAGYGLLARARVAARRSLGGPVRRRPWDRLVGPGRLYPAAHPDRVAALAPLALVGNCHRRGAGRLPAGRAAQSRAAGWARPVGHQPAGRPGLAGLVLVTGIAALIFSQLVVLVDVASLVMRFRRARGAERQQLRWVAMVAGLLAVAVVATVVGALTGHPAVSEWTSGLFVALLPVAIGAAILRYRLYDLDRIISRTLAYGLLTVLLGGGYAAVVLGLGRLLPQGSSLVVAAATLAVAAVFQPLRRRVQQAVDRRFNRRRHDAAETIQAFSTHLRDQLDLDTLGAELLAVVDQTMQPTQASLWLRPSYALSSAAGGRAARH